MFREIRPSSTASTPQKSNEPNNQRTAAPKRTITSLACTLCRQRRVKCDGRRPTCSACTVKGKVACEYDIGRAQRRTGVLQSRIHELETEISSLKRTGRSNSFSLNETSPTTTRGHGDSDMSFPSDDDDLYLGSGNVHQSEDSNNIMHNDLESQPATASSSTSYPPYKPAQSTSGYVSEKQSEILPKHRNMTGIAPGLERQARDEQRQARYRYRPTGDGLNLHLFGDISKLGLPQSQSSSDDGQQLLAGAQRVLVPFYLVQPLTYTDNQLLSRAYSSFLMHKRREIAQGASVDALVGTGRIDVSALVGEDGMNSADPISRFIASMLSSSGLQRLPEKLGIMHLLYVLLRWQIHPTAETYKDVPASLKPSAQQRLIPHPTWIDLVVWPDIRDALIMHPGILAGDGVECFPILMETACVRWPRDDAEMTNLDPETGRLVLTPDFVTHCEDINHWSVGSALIERFPALVDKVWVQDP